MASISALPLELLDNSDLDLQRCYIPSAHGSLLSRFHAWPWSKCVLDDGSFAVCRLVRRTGSESCCFLDDMVTSGHPFTIQNKHIKEIVPLKLVPHMNNVSCVLTIKQLEGPQQNITDKYEEVRCLLHQLMLVKGCFIRHQRFRDIGIECVEILDCANMKGDECFQLQPDASISIVNIRLEQPAALPKDGVFYPYGFEPALQALESLLENSRLSGDQVLPAQNALLVGPVGCGKSTLLAEFIRRNSCNCFHITASQVLGSYPGETEAELRNKFNAAMALSKLLKPPQPIIMVLEDLELFCPAHSSDANNAGNALRISAQLYKLIDNLQKSSSPSAKSIICVATTSTPDKLHLHARRAGRFSYEISIDIPSQQQRQELFAAYFRAHYPNMLLSNELLEHLGQQTQGYVVADVALLIRKMQHKLLLKNDSQVNVDVLVKQSLLDCQPSAACSGDIRVQHISEGFEIIGGMRELKRVLQVLVLAGIKHKEAYARFGLRQPKGVLLYGPPGCAKTTIAKCLAKEAHMTFISTSAAEVYSPYVGCAERFIARIFDTARRNAPCLIFLDEIDALVGRRTCEAKAGGGSNDVQLRILSTLLTEMDGIVGGQQSGQNILIVAATNRPEMLDGALVRPGRFDKMLHVTAPDKGSRIALLELLAKRIPFDPSISLPELAENTERFSGADLCNLCNEAAIEAFQRNFDATTIEWQDFQTVLTRVKPSLTQAQIDSYYKFSYRYLSK